MRTTPRLRANVSRVLNEDAAEETRLRREDERSRRNSRRNESEVLGAVYSEVVEERVTAAAVTEGMHAFDSLSRKAFDRLSTVVTEAGAVKTRGPVLMEELESFDPELMHSIRERAHAGVALVVANYVDQVSSLAAAVKLSSDEPLNEDYARGIPDFALQQVAADAVDGLRRHMRNHVNQTSTDPARQRKMLVASNNVLKDLEKSIKELLEDKLLQYMRSV